MLTPQSQNEIVSFDDEELSKRAKEIFDNLHAKNTLRAYQSDLKDFFSFLSDRGQRPDTVITDDLIKYFTNLEQRRKKHSTIQRRLIAIRTYYKQFGEEVEKHERGRGNHNFIYVNPASTDKMKSWMKSLSRTIGVAQSQKRPATKRIMNTLIHEIDGENLKDIRNRAILAIGYAGAFRRSEISALNLEDVIRDDEGIYLIVRKGKTDQEGQGLKKFIYYGDKASHCPVRLLETWISKARITEPKGALFRQVNKAGKVGDRISSTSIYKIIKDAVQKAGLNPDEFGGHSLRAGLITQLADAGVEEREIMAHSGHKSTEIMRRYIRESNIKKKSPTKGIL